MSRNEHFASGAIGGAPFRVVHEYENDDPDYGIVQAVRGEDDIIGQLQYHRNHSYFPEKTLYPDDLWVHSEHRGRGIATALHGAALEAHPELPMTHKVDAMTEDAQRMLPRLREAHPGRHKVYDDDVRRYL